MGGGRFWIVPMFAKVALFLALAGLSLAASSQGRLLGERQWTYRGKLQTATLFGNEPTICEKVKQYSGYFQFASDKKYFYWFFESRNHTASDPTIMWLTGGPGCSSMLALFTENGPCTVNSDGATTEYNPYSWTNYANMLYVDQPPGTGFSDGTYDFDEAGVAEDMYQFLQMFFAHYPAYNTSFFVFGESYAGHYVPSISHRIYLGNKQAQKSTNYIPLVGLAVGNGLTDPEIQYNYYADMAYNSTSAPSVISASTYKAMKQAAPLCIKQIQSCQSKSSSCQVAYSYCNLAEVEPYEKTGRNPYDMRIPCEYGNLCYNLTNVDAYLNRADVQKQLGVSKKWESCNMDVNQKFVGDWMKNYQDQLPDMLSDHIRVLIYAGDQDFICNWLGNKAWTLALPWSGQTEFNAAADNLWYVNGAAAGKIRTASDFTFLQVFQAGHMTPMDQPAAALEMVRQFLTHQI
eukprot:c5003_g1_i1.p1 GENE.c5003_g1_i1~~c5003_g1_i1.p1  ORF type:complete len:461 (+),score=77.84 c5003_g1_i1:1-1383(+)